MSRETINTARSELRSIGRTMSPATGAEARAQRRQYWMPWVWFLVGLLVVAGLVGVLFVVGPSPLSKMPTKSVVFSAPVRPG
jgi:uncharacterized membrane protein YhaH (DUF805 family)